MLPPACSAVRLIDAERGEHRIALLFRAEQPTP
jgi:hypothetical protein